VGSDTAPSLCAQNGTCKFQPDKAIAFVKDVINITQVSPCPALPLSCALPA